MNLFLPAQIDRDTGVVAIWVFVSLVGVVALIFLADQLKQNATPTVYRKLRKFLGPALLSKLQMHEKTFPAYDLASTNRALESFFAEFGPNRRAIGGLMFGIDFTVATQKPANLKSAIKPGRIIYERLPVDVGQEQSFPSNIMWLITLKSIPEKSGASGIPSNEKIVVLLRAAPTANFGVVDMTARVAPEKIVLLTIACSSQAVADCCFAEIERRRKQLNVFRGKFVDPVVGPGGIRSLAFRKLQPVHEADLILPDSVKTLVKSGIIDFYQNGERLEKLGIDLKRGILFYSLPGTGKTSISLYLAGLLPNFTVCFISGAKLSFPRELCSMARYLQPTMLVFEDIDLIAQERDRNSLATVLGELMNQIDGCDPKDQVLFILNTNSLDRIEAAVRNRPGRVDQIIRIPLPDEAAREKLIRLFGGKVYIADSAIDNLVRASKGATPALLKEVVKRAVVLAVTRNPSASENLEVMDSDLLLALEQVVTMRSDALAIGDKGSEAVL